MRMPMLNRWALVVVLMMVGLSSEAHADDSGLDHSWRAWLEGGIGGAQLNTRAPGLPGRHGAALLSVGFGFRVTRQLAIGFEYATNASLSGCQRWDCENRSWDFMPAFNRLTMFGEMRLLDGRVRLRYGVGDLSYCYEGGAGMNLWYLALDDDDYVDFYNCRSVHGMVKSASIGYHWRMTDGSDLVMAGFRLGVEDADMHDKPSVGLPAFHYRAVTLTLQFSFN